jgi:hypothetical protein
MLRTNTLPVGRGGSGRTVSSRDGFVPLMRELAGFRGYYLLAGGRDELIAISMFDSAGEALVSNEKAADWVLSTPERKCISAPEQRCIDDERWEVPAGSGGLTGMA